MRQNRATTAMAVFGVCLGLSTFADATVYYVDPGGSGDGGDSWPDAFRTLRDALTAGGYSQGDVIRVAGGTYYPDEWYEGDTFYDTNDRTKSFRLVSGVTLMGGYAGLAVPGSENDRHFGDYPTILSGDIDKDDVVDDDNSYHVVVSDLNPAGTLIDGFIIECGNADDDDNDNHNIGGGALLQGTFVTFVRCTIRNNKAIGDSNTPG